MYKVKCPFCQRVTTHPFVRVGAVGTCAGCDKRFRIREQHVTRAVRIVPVPAGEMDPLLPHEPPRTMSTTREDLAEATGLSGLSRLMEEAGGQSGAGREGKTKKSIPRKTDAASGTTEKNLPRESMEQVQTRLRRRRQRSIYLMVAGSGAAAALLVVAIWLATQPRHPMRSPESNYSQGSSAVIASVDAVTPGQWKPVDPAQPFALPTTQSEVSVTGSALERKGGKIYFTAMVTNHSDVVVRRATIHLALLNKADGLVAACDVPVALLAQGVAEPIRVRLPAGVTLAGAKVKAFAGQVQAMPGAKALARPMRSNLTGEGKATAVEIYFQNPLNQPLSRVFFLVTASDGEHQPVGQWVVKWDDQVAPGNRVVLKAVTPVSEGMDAAMWQVRAVGLP